MELQHASEDFERFLVDARDLSGLATRNQVYTMVQAVLQVFRRRLDVKEAINFANVLPPILRAIFVTDWDIDESRQPFECRRIMTAEVQALRADHNFAPETAIRDVALALRRHIDEAAFNCTLTQMPKGAPEFWCI
jgi:uncharacterized protein (DUF2267 family)